MKIGVRRPKSDKQRNLRDKGKLIGKAAISAFLIAAPLISNISCMRAERVKEIPVEGVSEDKRGKAKADSVNVDSVETKKTLPDSIKKEVVRTLSRDRLFKGGF